ncbi:MULTISPECIES: HAAS signaling domain-containing protein [Actinoplanes]|uniref:Uncharacterized protein n=2 Tax=Actinoplanes TaxID=1865 RepID=A0A0X3VAV1_9ACTN|nr:MULTISPECIES: hypothetical protein [Actinoplanes]KUL41734.1 hypothetical protein ADL15_03155 [Actinoplanes awajinensis subsp. mycoplanecinus]GIE68690.1 hypothetical protein Apa02nite_047980 [Actinoplanes palleronii]
MTTTALAQSALARSDELVLDYLAELWAGSADLPPDLRDELMRTVTDYLALRHEPGADPAPVLARLGPPEQLVDATRRGYLPLHLRVPLPAPAPPGPARVSVVGGADSTAIALLVGGTFLMPVISPVAGLLIATGSPRWSTGQKAAAWVLTGGTAAFALLMAMALIGTGAGEAFALFLAYLVACGGSVVAGLSLLIGLRHPDPR